MIGSPPRVSLVDVDRGQLIFRKMIVIVRRLLAVAVALSVGFAPSVLRVPAAVAGPWPALGDPTPVTPATAPAAVAPPAVMSEVTTPGATALDRVTISTDTTWGPQGSPYVITNGLTVAAPRALARELGDGRTGGYFGSAEDAVAAAGRGPVGATLQAGTGPGHMVVTSPLGEGRFLVQDPWAGGSTYEVGSDWIGQFVSGGVFR